MVEARNTQIGKDGFDIKDMEELKKAVRLFHELNLRSIISMRKQPSSLKVR